MPFARFALSHLAAALSFAAVCLALGRRLAALGCPALRERRWGLPLAVGLGAIAGAASLLAALGLLNRPSLLLLGIGAAGAAAAEWRPLLGEVRDLALGRRGPWAAALVVATLPCGLLALYPPTGFDALLYHFPAAARFAASGRITVIPELRFPAFPWLNEVLFAAAMRLQDDVAAQCVQWVVHLATAALLWEGCRDRFGRWAAILAVSLWLGDPLAAWLAASAYVEPLLALFLLATMELLDLARRTQAPRCLLLAGGLAGCAAATKYQGLLAIVLVGAWSFLGARRVAGAPAGLPGRLAPLVRLPPLPKIDIGLRAALPPLLAAAIVALPWYVWVAHATGDPLHPLLTRLRHLQSGRLDPMPSWEVLVRLPWSTLRRVLWPYPPGSPLLWLLWPLPLLAWRRLPAAGRLAAAGLAIGLVITALHPNPRLVSVAAPLLAAAIGGAAAAWAVARWGAEGAAPRLLALALLALLPAGSYTALLVVRRGAVPSGAAARETYLRAQLPGYAALAWLNSSYGRRYTVYGLWAEELRYYAAGRFLGDWYGPAPFSAALALVDRPAELHAFLAAHAVDHLLIRQMAWQRDPTPLALLAGGRGAAFFRPEYHDDQAAVWALATAGAAAGTAPPGGT